jgi:hypothetical protein
MADCVHGTDDNLITVSQLSDRLGWDSFLEGRISLQWLLVVAPLLRHIRQYLLPLTWGRQLISSRLHNIVHQQQQWIYHNSLIHFKVKDRLNIPEHHDIINRVESYACSDPDTLLPHHRFLFEADSEELVSGPTSHRLLWLADMDIAIATSSLGRLGTLTPQASTYFLQTRQLVWCKPGWTTL